MRHPLTDQYTAGRLRLLDLGRSLTADQASQMTLACPAWSVKDVYAHLAGIATDILNNNTENAATVEWADGHVADRLARTFTEVLEEWTEAGAEVSNVMEAFGDAFPLQLFIDQWTHEWDIRAALGPPAAATPDTTIVDHYLDDLARAMVDEAADAGLPTLEVAVGATIFSAGAGPSVGRLDLTSFEFGRISMGRRSRRQLAALRWPDRVNPDQIRQYSDTMVRWSVSPHDVVDPVGLRSAPQQ